MRYMVGVKEELTEADLSFGHVTRTEGSRLPAVALYGQVKGTRGRGRQPKK